MTSRSHVNDEPVITSGKYVSKCRVDKDPPVTFRLIVLRKVVLAPQVCVLLADLTVRCYNSRC